MGGRSDQEGDYIRQRAPYVDVIFALKLHRLPEMIKSLIQRSASDGHISFLRSKSSIALPEPRAEGATAFVSRRRKAVQVLYLIALYLHSRQ
ncbi:hypothetical protein OK016_13625 [Vibrio chagasii]|nr:hypothetical protein [Vibrio chagasii]